MEVLPGPTATATAYVASGCTNPRFYFGGFFNGNLWIVGVAAAVLAVIVTVAVSLFTKPVDPAVLNRMKGLKAEG